MQITRIQKAESMRKFYQIFVVNLVVDIESDIIESTKRNTGRFVVNASTGYEITLNLDANMKFLSINERHLSWVHATTSHGKEVMKLILSMTQTLLCR